MVEITPENARAYLIERGQIAADAPAVLEPLGGGISNVVIQVRLPRDCFVFKQSLPKLRVAEDWPFDRERILVERDCMALLSEVLPPAACRACASRMRRITSSACRVPRQEASCGSKHCWMDRLI